MLKFSKSTPNSFVTASPLDESTRETLASRREATEEVNNALRSYFKTASKQRDVPNEKRKALPVEIVGEAMLRAESTPMHSEFSTSILLDNRSTLAPSSLVPFLDSR